MNLYTVASQASAAAITFTKAYRQIVRGDLVRGGKLVLRYDPQRLPLPPSFAHGAAEHQFFGHIRFRDDGPITRVQLWSPTGVVETVDIDESGQGSVLVGIADIPIDAEDISIWFSYEYAGSVQYDSDFGKNFHFVFPGELKITKAKVSGCQGKPCSQFDVEADADVAITAITIIFHSFQPGQHGVSKSFDLKPIGKANGRQKWSGSNPVAWKATVSYEVSFVMAGSSLHVDKQGRPFMAEMAM